MMIFDSISGKITVKPDTLLIPELREIYENDTSFDKAYANKLFVFIHLVSRIDPNAPLFEAKEEELEQLAVQYAFRENTELDDELREKIYHAVEAYLKAYEKIEVRLIKTFNKKIDQLESLINKTNPKITENISEKGTTYTSNVGILNKAMTELDSLMDTRDKLYARLMKDSSGNSKFRGGTKPSRQVRKAMQRRQA